MDLSEMQILLSVSVMFISLLWISIHLTRRFEWFFSSHTNNDDDLTTRSLFLFLAFVRYV